MTVDERPIRDDDLHAFVDGLLDSERQEEIQHYLAQHPEAAARVSAWQKDGEILRQALDWQLKEAVPATLNITRLIEPRDIHHRAFLRLAASIVIALMVGTGTGWMVRGPSVPSGISALSLEAAAAHRVFATGLGHSTTFDVVDPARLASWTQQALGRAVTPPNLTGAGYHLVGARLAATGYGPACMFFYSSDRGPPITLFVRQMNGHDMNAPMREIRMPEAIGYAWSRQGLGVSLISTNPMPSLHSLSNRVRNEMDSRT
jgi:anti-sigma factor RsiW